MLPTLSRRGLNACFPFVRQLSTGASKSRHYLIIGPPGGGKGTICSRITEHYGISVLGSGDLIRSEISNQTELGVQAKSLVSQGQLVPDELVTKLVLSQLRAFPGADPWILDGFPRTLPQADQLDDTCPVSSVLYIDIPFETIIERLTGRLFHPASGRTYHKSFQPPKIEGLDDITGEHLEQRVDDNEETVRARLETYRKETEPLIQHYQKLGLIQHFPGTETNKIYPKIQEYLDQFHSRV